MAHEDNKWEASEIATLEKRLVKRIWAIHPNDWTHVRAKLHQLWDFL